MEQWTKENFMTIKHFIAAALASFVALASVAPALANFDYYEGVDINAKRGVASAAKKPDGRATGAIRTKAATYFFPSTAKPVPQVVKGGEGEYYQGLSRH
jgi:predicted transcriptional regulator